jgi:D-serine dehydratase
MRSFTERAGVEVCPHGKTTMAPQLFQLQLAAGALLRRPSVHHVR